MKSQIIYEKRKQYKYKLCRDYKFKTDIIYGKNLQNSLFPIASINIFSYLEISSKGTLLIKKGYAWDGPSGPAIDTKNFMRGSLVHDALYQLMREGMLPYSTRKKADKILRKICLEDGMSRIRAWYIYYAVRTAGGKYAKINIQTAP